MPMTQPVPSTLSEIARRAGVSKGTASRILNNKNKENRPADLSRAQRVRRIADELGYRPNAAARSIFSGRFNAAALITCGEIGADYFPRLMLHGIHDGLQSMKYRMVYGEVPAVALRDPDYVPHALRESNVDALMVYPNPRFSEEVVPYFEQLRQPTVWLNLTLGHNAVYVDEAGGAEIAVQGLLARGRRRLGYLGDLILPRNHHYSTAARRDGWLAAMRGRGLETHRCRNYDQTEGVPSTIDAAGRFLADFADLDAVVCYEQREALALQVAALRRGIRVPEDLLIIGFHETPIDSAVGLPIPTVVIPFIELGRAATRMTAALLDDPSRRAASVAIAYPPDAAV